MNEKSRPGSGFAVWLTAVRPFAYPASIVPVILGLSLAHCMGYAIQWWPFALTLIGVVSFHTAANLLNDCYDHRRGIDTEIVPTSGAVVRGWLTEGQAFRGAMVCLAIGAACGFVLVCYAGWVVLLLGLVGAVTARGPCDLLRLRPLASFRDLLGAIAHLQLGAHSLESSTGMLYRRHSARQ